MPHRPEPIMPETMSKAAGTDDAGDINRQLRSVLAKWGDTVSAGDVAGDEAEELFGKEAATFARNMRSIRFDDGKVTITNREGREVPLEVELAITPAQKAMGLMHRSELPEGRGMAFVFGGDEERSFWMKNTHIPLDAAFCGPKGQIRRIASLEPQNIDPVEAEAMVVVETPSGWMESQGIEEGCKLQWGGLKEHSKQTKNAVTRRGFRDTDEAKRLSEGLLGGLLDSVRGTDKEEDVFEAMRRTFREILQGSQEKTAQAEDGGVDPITKGIMWEIGSPLKLSKWIEEGKLSREDVIRHARMVYETMLNRRRKGHSMFGGASLKDIFYAGTKRGPEKWQKDLAPQYSVLDNEGNWRGHIENTAQYGDILDAVREARQMVESKGYEPVMGEYVTHYYNPNVVKERPTFAVKERFATEEEVPGTQNKHKFYYNPRRPGQSQQSKQAPSVPSYYTVQPGDTPSGIVNRFGIKEGWEPMLKVNNIPDSKSLPVGKRLDLRAFIPAKPAE